MSRAGAVTLLNQTVTTTVNGAAFGVGLGVEKAALTLTGSAFGGTTPSFTVKVQHSFDTGTSWLDLVTFTAMTANGSQTLFASEDAGTVVIGPTFRAIVSAASGTTPTALLVVTATVKD